MYKTLKRESLKYVLPRIVVCALAAAILLAVCAGGLVHLMVGPVDLKQVDTNQLDGEYVSFDASEVIVAFANLTAKGDSGSKTIKTYYLLPVGDGSYMAVMDRKEHNANILDRAMEQSHEYYLGDLETLTKLGTLSGTVKPLEDDMVSYMTDCIDNYALPGYEEGRDSARLIVSYQVNLGYVGFLTTTWIAVLGAMAGVAVLLLVVQLVVLFGGVYQKSLRALIGDRETGFDVAVKVERIRVADYIWYTKGPGSRAIATEDVVWGYAMPEPMVVSKYRWPVALYTKDQKLVRLTFMEQKNCQVFLDVVAAQGKPFIQGYTSEYSQMFQQDMERFMREAEQAAKERNP